MAMASSRRVRVFDTVNAACGQALLVWRAAELAALGHDEAEVLAELARLRPQTRMWAIAPDISHAVRGGRIPRWAAPIARLSALTPMAKMSVDGRMVVAGANMKCCTISWRRPSNSSASVRVPCGVSNT